MKYLFALGHPAHYHLFKLVIAKLIEKGHEIVIVYTGKDILEDLLFSADNISYFRLDGNSSHTSLISKGIKIIKSTLKLFKIAKSQNPILMVGCLTQIGYVGRLLRIKTIFVGEDDIDYTYLQARITYPFVDYILAPTKTNIGKYSYKKIGYEGYQKLAYLHPKYFVPEPEKVIIKSNYFLIRLARLNAYHDVDASGLTDDIVLELIKLLEPYGQIIISSERELPSELIKYVLPVKKSDMHHYLAFAAIYFGDSQSMAVEAAILGTPGIRFNSFVGKISILKELEEVYHLSNGIESSRTDELFKVTRELLNSPNIKDEYAKRAKVMLDTKIDVNSFFLWFFENFPASLEKVKINPQNLEF